MPALLLTAALLAASPAPEGRGWSERNGDRVVAVAGDQIVTVSDVRRELSPLLRNLKGSAAEQEAAVRQASGDILRTLSDRAIVLREFRESGMVIPPAMLQAEIDDQVRRLHGGDRLRFFAALREAGTTPAEHRRQVEERMIFDYEISKVRRSIGEASPARIQAFYDANPQLFARAERVRFRQISVLRRASESPEETLARAKSLEARLAGDPAGIAARFEAAAREGSDDDYRAQGGAAGWRDLEELAGPVAEALRKVADGAATPLLTLDAGPDKAHFLLLREELRPAGKAPIEEVRAAIGARIRDELSNQAVQEWLERLREKHDVVLR